MLPDASAEVKLVVGPCGPGRLLMNGEMSVATTFRPSSARILKALGSVTTSSRPSPGLTL